MKLSDRVRPFTRFAPCPVPGLTGDCWIWTGKPSGGYGNISFEGKTHRVHRLIYEHVVGPITPPLVTDHLCRVRACFNPFHIEPVTNKENVLRGLSFSAFNARKTHCSLGHPFDEENTRFSPHPSGSIQRKCAICHRAVVRKSAAKSRRLAEMRGAKEMRGK